MYRFREQGHMYHFIDDLVASNEKPNNLQLYFSDHENELASRMAKKPQTIRGKANDKKGLRSHGTYSLCFIFDLLKLILIII